METLLNYVMIISNALLVIGAFSAFVVYFMQKHSEKRMAATLILGQINSIDNQLMELKKDTNVNPVTIFNMKPILKENMWEKYKHLFAAEFSGSEYKLIQTYFEQAEFLERRRVDIINTVYSAWKDKSSVEHQVIGHAIFNDFLNGTDNSNSVEAFSKKFREIDTVFVPDIAFVTLMNSLHGFNLLSGTTAYAKLNKKAFLK